MKLQFKTKKELCTKTKQNTLTFISRPDGSDDNDYVKSNWTQISH